MLDFFQPCLRGFRLGLRLATGDADITDGRPRSRTYAIIGAAVEVHKELGPGYLEAVYHEALAKELRSRGIAVGSEVAFVVHYKGKANWTTSEADTAAG